MFDLSILELVNITPNEYCILNCINNNEPFPKWNTVNPEYRKLRCCGWVTKSGKLSIKSIDLLERLGSDIVIKENSPLNELRNKIKEYNDLFPNIQFPSGVAARAPMSALEPRFKWFFENHNYQWDIILGSTKRYLEQKLYQGWDKTICAKYFVKKTKGGIDESVLAELCNIYLNGDDTHQLNIFKDNTF